MRGSTDSSRATSSAVSEAACALAMLFSVIFLVTGSVNGAHRGVRLHRWGWCHNVQLRGVLLQVAFFLRWSRVSEKERERDSVSRQLESRRDYRRDTSGPRSRCTHPHTELPLTPETHWQQTPNRTGTVAVCALEINARYAWTTATVNTDTWTMPTTTVPPTGHLLLASRLLLALCCCLPGASAVHRHYARIAAWQRVRPLADPCNSSFEICVRKFSQELTFPPVAVPQVGADGSPNYTLPMSAFSKLLHPDMPGPTLLYGYDGSWPGPTIYADVGVTVHATFPNALPTTHILPVDETVCDLDPGGRASVHLHGNHNEWESDGDALAWYTPDWATLGTNWRQREMTYDNTRGPGMLFYHDHADCITRLNVYAGLQGLFILRNVTLDAELGLPSGPDSPYDVPLVLADRSFNADGSLQYPRNEDGDPASPITILPEYFGNVSLVNGQIWPRLTVQPTLYRFRILDASNDRFYNLGLFVANATGDVDLSQPGPDLVVIATEGGCVASVCIVATDGGCVLSAYLITAKMTVRSECMYCRHGWGVRTECLYNNSEDDGA